MKTKKACYRIENHGGKFIGIAWNYDEGVLLGTETYETYTYARNRLQYLADSHYVTLDRFMGEYHCNCCLHPKMGEHV